METSTSSVQFYQVRHKELGIYQGSFFGLGFWHPTSNSLEQGIAKFTKEEAEEYITFLCSNECASPMKKEDLSIEPFDGRLDFEMTHQGTWT